VNHQTYIWSRTNNDDIATEWTQYVNALNVSSIKLVDQLDHIVWVENNDRKIFKVK
jgi:hypothetical protein